MSTDLREERLPKWAKDEMARLRRDAEQARQGERKARLDTRPDASDTILDSYEPVPIGLGKGTRVRFIVGDASDAWIDVHVETPAGSSRPHIEVHGGCGLRITPRVSNAVWVRTER